MTKDLRALPWAVIAPAFQADCWFLDNATRERGIALSKAPYQPSIGNRTTVSASTDRLTLIAIVGKKLPPAIRA